MTDPLSLEELDRLLDGKVYNLADALAVDQYSQAFWLEPAPRARRAGLLPGC